MSEITFDSAAFSNFLSLLLRLISSFLGRAGENKVFTGNKVEFRLKIKRGTLPQKDSKRE